jgi:intein-encoded DNA endonuclease-like protein
VNLDYLAGIIDGEASFIVVFKKDARYKIGTRIVMRFSLPQRDRRLLEMIRDYLGMGSIYYHRRDDLWYYEI